MATFVICAVRDRAMDAFMQPFFAPAVGLATRSFGDEVRKTESPMNAHPEDYDLYQLGTYEDDRGAVIPLADGPKMLAIGKEQIAK